MSINDCIHLKRNLILHDWSCQYSCLDSDALIVCFASLWCGIFFPFCCLLILLIIAPESYAGKVIGFMVEFCIPQSPLCYHIIRLCNWFIPSIGIPRSSLEVFCVGDGGGLGEALFCLPLCNQWISCYQCIGASSICLRLWLLLFGTFIRVKCMLYFFQHLCSIQNASWERNNGIGYVHISMVFVLRLATHNSHNFANSLWL